MSELRLARVVAVHPASRSVDLVFLDDGSRYPKAMVLSTAASSDAGVWNVPSVPRPSSEMVAMSTGGPGRVLVAACIFMRGQPVVVGWAPNPSSPVAVREQDRELHLHPSGAYWTIAPDGSIELFHPSGALFRIGAGGHQDLTPVSAGAWQTPGGASPPQITLSTAGTTITVEPNGPVTIQTAGELRMAYQKAVLTGDIELTGKLTATGEVKGAGVALSTHKHTNVQTGGSQSGQPVPGS